jgi:hypothetical protein
MQLGPNWFEDFQGRGPGGYGQPDHSGSQANGLVTGKPPNWVVALTPLDD